MVIFLFALASLIALLQLGLMGLLRRLVQQLDSERRRIDALEAMVGSLSSAAPAVRSAPRAAVAEPTPWVAPAPAPERTPRVAPGRGDVAPALTATLATTTTAGLASAAPNAGAAPVDPAALRSEMLALVQQLVAQGLSLREIAAHCGLSEAEAELMLSLQGSAR